MDTAFTVINTIAEIGIDCVSVYCPAVGIVVKGMHYLDKAADIWRTKDDYDFLDDWLIDTLYGEVEDKVKDKLKSETLGKLDGALIAEALSVAAEFGISEEVGKIIVKLFKATEKSLREEVISNASQNDPFGNYDKAIGLFQKRVKDQKFCQTIVNNVPEVVSKIYAYVNYNN